MQSDLVVEAPLWAGNRGAEWEQQTLWGSLAKPRAAEPYCTEHIRAGGHGVEGKVEIVEGTGSEIYVRIDCAG